MIASLVLAALVATPSPSPLPSASLPPAQAPTAIATPVASPAATPVAGPASASANPAMPLPAPAGPTATPEPLTYRFVPRYTANRPADEPQIFAVYLNSKKLRSLGPIHIRVATTPNVVKVISRSNGRDGVIPEVSPGHFEATSMLPKLPFIAAGMTLDLEFIATTAAGKKSVVRVPVQLN